MNNLSYLAGYAKGQIDAILEIAQNCKSEDLIEYVNYRRSRMIDCLLDPQLSEREKERNLEDLIFILNALIASLEEVKINKEKLDEILEPFLRGF